jgi:hypothetical protein
MRRGRCVVAANRSTEPTHGYRPINIVFVGDPLTAKIVVALAILAIEGHDSRSPLISKILDEVGYEITAACPVSTDLS